MKYIVRIVTDTIYSLIVALTIDILRPISLKIENKKVHVILQNKLKKYSFLWDLSWSAERNMEKSDLTIYPNSIDKNIINN